MNAKNNSCRFNSILPVTKKIPERSLLYLSEIIPETICLCRLETPLAPYFINHAIEALTGYSRTLFLEAPSEYAKLIHPHDLIGVFRSIDTCQTHTYSIKYRFHHNSGFWITLKESGTIFTDNDDEPIILKYIRCL